VTPLARSLAEVLLDRHRRICRTFNVGQPEAVGDNMIQDSTIEYGILSESAGYPNLGQAVSNPLGEIAEWCATNSFPPLNSLAVSKETHMPSEGYERAAGCSLLHWPEQVRRCIAFRGYPDRVNQ
jgi:hypothetical protein